MRLGPVLEEVGAAATAAKICKINVDENQANAAKYSITTIPALLIFKDGKEVNRIIGTQSKTDLLAALEKFA
jgi:thioredoxin 1